MISASHVFAFFKPYSSFARLGDLQAISESRWRVVSLSMAPLMMSWQRSAVSFSLRNSHILRISWRPAARCKSCFLRIFRSSL